MTNQPHTAIVTCHNHLADKYNEINIGVFSPNICYKYSIQLTKIYVEIIRSVGNTNSSNWSERVACAAMGNNLLEVMNLKPGKLGKGYIFKKNKTVRNIKRVSSLFPFTYAFTIPSNFLTDILLPLYFTLFSYNSLQPPGWSPSKTSSPKAFSWSSFYLPQHFLFFCLLVAKYPPAINLFELIWIIWFYLVLHWEISFSLFS